MRRRLVAGPVVVAVVLLVSGCGGGDGDAEAHESDAGGRSVSLGAADTDTCVREATQVSSLPDGYPADFPLPSGTVVFHVEDRGDDGVIATGITSSPFADVLTAMNAARTSGFRVTDGETEEDDAEADWQGNGYVGRWAVEKSATCPGETVIQVLSKRA